MYTLNQEFEHWQSNAATVIIDMCRDVDEAVTIPGPDVRALTQESQEMIFHGHPEQLMDALVGSSSVSGR